MNKKLLHFALTTLLLLIFITPPLRGWGQTYTWQLANSIAVGDVVALVNANVDKELSGISTTSTKYGTGADVSNSTPTGVYPLTVVEGNNEGSFAFKNSGDSYLYWTSGNSLNVNSTLNANTSWTVSFDEETNNATIKNCYTDTRVIKWNSDRFACYTTATGTLVKLYKRVSVTTHTLTITQPAEGGTIAVTDADNNPVESGSQIAEGAELTLTATPAAGYEFTQWTATSGDINDNASAITTFTMGTIDATISASFVQNTTEYSVNVASGITNGTVMANPTSCVSGTTVTLTITPATGYHLESLTITDTDNNEIEYTTDYTFTMPASNVTVTATFTNTLTDVLTATLVNQAMSGNSGYQAWSSVTSNSEAVYAGQSNKTTSYIQIRNQNPSGIVSTTSGGYVKKVALEWKGSNADNRKITVYGKNTAYDSPADLYSDDKRGEELGTIVYNTSTELVITGDYMYVGLKSDGAAYFEPLSITWQPVTKYNVTCLTPTDGTIAADPTSAPEGATVTLTATPSSHYHLVSWTVLDGDAQTVTVAPDATDPNKATFTMPASNVEVDATFAEDAKYTITIPTTIEDYVAVDATSNQAYAGDEVTIIVTPPTGKVLETLSVKDGDDVDVAFTPAVSSAVDEYTFVMPASNVTIVATFADPTTYTVTYYVNGTVLSSEQVVEGSQANLPATANVPSGYNFVGWTTDESVSTIVATFSPDDNASLYAVFAKNEPVTYTFTITTNDFNGTSYAANDGNHTVTATSSSGETMTVGYTTSDIMRNNTSGVLTIQWKSGSGTMYNTTDLGVITSINVAETTANVLTTIVGSTQQPDTEGSGGYFCIKNNGSSAGKASSVTVTFSKDKTFAYTRLIDVTSATEMANIPATHLVTVQSGGTLTLTGANQGTAANLIIEDGGQLITTNAVAATLKKNISKYEGEKDNYYLIATPVVAGTNAEAVAIGTYDLYSYDEPTHYWMNAEAEGATLTTLTNGTGYLYANAADQTLEFVGTMKARGSHPTATLTASATELTGFNLVGNPFPCNLSINDLKVGTEAVSTIYQIDNTEIGEVTVAQNTTIAPAEGFFVVATAGGTLHFEPQTEGSTANAVSDLLMEVRASERNAKLIDRAYVNFNQGSNVAKFQLNEANAKLYIPQGSKDYAVVRSQGEGELPVNFKADKNGAYTLSVRPENVEMDYLHLIDNLTGTEVDLLATPTYTFNAKKTDYASRFRLVFSTTGVEENGTETNASFAFFNGSEWVVNADDNATLEVIDMMGRTVLCKDVARNVSTNGWAQGVYMFRLTDGNSVKTQKIVVR